MGSRCSSPYGRRGRRTGYEAFTKKTYYPWRRDLDGFESGPTQPVVHISWEDADYFCKWLTRTELRAGRLAIGDLYRLPTDHEWSCAVGIATAEDAALWPSQKDRRLANVFPWGNAWPPPSQAGNLGGEELSSVLAAGKHSYIGQVLTGYHDDFTMTAPVGSFPPDQNGLHDVCGNVAEWVDDWWDGDRKLKTVRGAGWLISDRGFVSSSFRGRFRVTESYNGLGFRCVLVSAGTSATSASSKPVPSASLVGSTKDQPFVNSLGMKFVPVPGTKVLMCIHETRRQDYATYASEVPGVDRFWTRDITLGERGDTHPVSGLDWSHAKAFCTWLSKRDGVNYRLPTDQEWSFAVGIGERESWSKDSTLESLNLKVRNEYPWGTLWPPPKGAGNYGDLNYLRKYPSEQRIEGYDDGFATAAPVMSFQPNRLGIYDLGGNIREMCAGWTDPHQDVHILRGAAWNNHGRRLEARRLESSWREADMLNNWTFDKGFRCVVELPAEIIENPPPQPPNEQTSQAEASKDNPFANTLGMKFVPVPGSTVLMCIHETRRKDYAAFAATNPGVDTTWQKVMDKGLPVSAGDDDPVAAVNWNDASAFCEWLSKKEGKKYRLPTELEWGLAVVHDFPDRSKVDPKELWEKLSTQVPWLGGTDPENPPDDGGNYRDSINDFATTALVMSFKPNELGIYDLSGNVWEWCDDWAESQHINKVLKGCGWKNFGTFLRSGNRVKLPPGLHGPPDSGLVETFSGFRCVLDEGHIVATSVPPVKIESPPEEEVVPTTMPAVVAVETPFINSLGMKFVPVPGTDVLMCIHETRKQDYLTYSRAVPGVNCAWKAPERYGVPISDKLDHPVVSTNWDDARQFCLWLSKREGRTYRLPTDREWSEAVGIAQDEIWDGNATPQMRSRKVGNRYPWGTGFPPASEARCGNFADMSLHEAIPVDPFIEGYTDGYATTAPVMSFKPNNLGIYDLGGNIWEWVDDWLDASQVDRVVRGASFLCNAEPCAVSSMRQKHQPNRRDPDVGFRCVLEHRQPKAEVKPVTAQATKEQPLTNSLGMKFVPVPGSTVLMCIHETRRKDYAAYGKANEGVDKTWEHIVHQGVPVADGDDHPVAAVSWDDATAFCEWLGKQEGKKYRLPTEFEWNLAVVHYLDDRSRVTAREVAQRIYTQVPWLGDTNVNPPPDDAGNYRNSQKQFPSTAPVMSCKPNELGIYDLGGNVWEWCWDWFDDQKTDRVLRGASWANHNTYLRSATRVKAPQELRDAGPADYDKRTPGFRCVIELGPQIIPAEPPKPPPGKPTAPLPFEVTKDKPFTNSLDMNFVPVTETKVLMCIHETRKKDYAAYAAENKGVDAQWSMVQLDELVLIPTPEHPAHSISWDDAHAFCEWLSNKENRRYRLPSDREWSAAVGIADAESADEKPGSLNGQLKGRYPWGDQYPPPEGAGNFADMTLHDRFANAGSIEGYTDGVISLAPVMSFTPNDLGLYDLAGNAWEWCEDDYDAGGWHFTRGGCWDSHGTALLSSTRKSRSPKDSRDNRIGFRCVLETED